MTRWNSLSGHRGDATENLINTTNEYYRKTKIAVINKNPIPIKVLEIKEGKITLAYFEGKSNLDYSGIAQGYSIYFDCKETEQKSLPLANIHKHQIEFMEDYRYQKGYAFILAYYKLFNKYVLIPTEIISHYYRESLRGGRKSIPFDALDSNFIIPQTNGFLNYLKTLNVYIDYIEEGKFDALCG